MGARHSRWLESAVIYQVLVDRFSGFPERVENSADFVGGTLRGVEERLDHIVDLGANTVWLSPIAATEAYHGYHVTDFLAVEPRFGVLDDLQRLIRAAHDRDLWVMADFVPNHCSDRHPFFLEAQSDRSSPFVPWFHFLEWPHDYLCFMEYGHLPQLNLSYPPAVRHVLRAALEWLDLGLDGFRLDHVIGPPMSFWKKFSQTVRRSFPEAVLLGEVNWFPMNDRMLKSVGVKRRYKRKDVKVDQTNLFREYVKVLDGVLDFHTHGVIKDSVHSGAVSERPEHVRSQIDSHRNTFPEGFSLCAFLDSHDEDRLMFYCGNDHALAQRAFSLLVELPQPIVIYNGTEFGMSQPGSIHDLRPHGDLLARAPLTWERKGCDFHGFVREELRRRRRRLAA